MNKTFVYGSSVIAIVIAVIALFVAFKGPATPQIQDTPQLGGVTKYDEVDATAIKIGGSSGTRVGPIIVGTCSLIRSSYTSLAASTSLAADCAVTGVVTGDYVFAQFATSSSNGAGWLVTQSSASSTGGYITLDFVNNTGAAATIPISIASTTQYQIFHPRATVPGL